MKSPVSHLLLAAATLAAASSAHAATQAWNTGGPSNNWNTTDTNWTGATAWTNGNDATFGGAGEAISINTTGISAHNLTFGGSGYSITTNTLTLTGTTPTIEVTNGSDTATISSILAGTADLTKTGAGTLNLTGVNTYTGTTAVNGGTLILSPTSALTTFNFSSQNYTLSNNATLRFDLSTVGANNTWLNAGLGSTNTTGGTVELHTDSTRHGSYGSSNAALLAKTSFTGSGNLNKTGTGIIDFLDTSTLATFTGAININEGMLSFQMGTAGQYSGQSTLNVAASATADVRSGILFVDALNGVTTSKVTSSYTTGKTLSVGNNGGSGAFAGVIENGSASSVAFTKNGSGTQILSGANTYSGVTTVNAGTLLANNTTGSATGTGAVSIASGARLGGSGTVSGAVTVAGGVTGGTIRGGTGAVTTDALTIGGKVTLASGSIVELALGSATGNNHSSLNFNGTGDVLTSGLVFSFLDLGATTGTYTGIITGVDTAADLTGWSIANAGWVGTFSQVGANINLNLTAVPEPSTYGLIGAGALAGVAFVRRRRKHAGAAA